MKRKFTQEEISYLENKYGAQISKATSELVQALLKLNEVAKMDRNIPFVIVAGSAMREGSGKDEKFAMEMLHDLITTIREDIKDEEE